MLVCGADQTTAESRQGGVEPILYGLRAEAHATAAAGDWIIPVEGAGDRQAIFWIENGEVPRFAHEIMGLELLTAPRNVGEVDHRRKILI